MNNDLVRPRGFEEMCGGDVEVGLEASSVDIFVLVLMTGLPHYGVYNVNTRQLVLRFTLQVTGST